MATLYSYRVTNEDSEVKFRGRVARNARVNAVGENHVANIAVFVKRSWKNRETGEFEGNEIVIECALWGPSAEQAGNIKAGDIVSVTGSMADLVAKPWQTEDGKSGIDMKMRCSSIRIVAQKVGGTEAEPQYELQAEPGLTEVSEEDVPL